MPIRPEMKGRYPANWREIREQILARAGHCCERCGVENHAIGYRDKAGAFHEAPGMQAEAAWLDGVKTLRIVLTIAHVENPDPADCRPENLQALCQRCHNRLDAPMRAKNGAETRKRRKAAGALPGLEAGTP